MKEAAFRALYSSDNIILITYTIPVTYTTYEVNSSGMCISVPYSIKPNNRFCIDVINPTNPTKIKTVSMDFITDIIDTGIQKGDSNDNN